VSRNLRTFVAYLCFSITLITIGAGFGALALASRVRTGAWNMPTRTDLVWLADLVHDASDDPSRVVYLDPNALTVFGGGDDAHRNRSGMVPAGMHAVLPGYTGSEHAWGEIVKCVRNRFADFDVAMTEQRPSSPGYTMVAVGGKPADLGVARERVSGLSPFNGEPLANSIVFAFSATHANRVRDTCETIAHEIGHTYGLDHSFQCKDIMTHLTGCGAKRFLDTPVPCGEQSQRPCHGEEPTQSSRRTLMGILGPRTNS
jgi:hypothetical protein